jgi:hypothetical protein
MKKFALMLIGAIVFTACSPITKEISVKTTDVADIYDEVFTFVKETHPEAILVGYNNHGTTFDRINLVPNERDTSGELNYWVYIFAKSKELLADNTIDDEDVFSVEFYNGTLSLHDYAQTRGSDISEDPLTNSKPTLGSDMLKPNSSDVFAQMQAAIDEEIYHINFNARPTYYEVTAFTSNDGGYDGVVNFETGKIENLRTVNIVSY